MTVATDAIREEAQGVLTGWLDGAYFSNPNPKDSWDEDEWHLKLTDDEGPGQVFIETVTRKRYRIEMRVTRL